MDENERPEKQDNLAYIVYEAAMARGERTIKRLFVIVILLIVLLVGTNAAWLYYESQWDIVESWEVVQENDGGYNNYIGNDGDIINGETNDNKN